jgi:hypothetical protein
LAGQLGDEVEIGVVGQHGELFDVGDGREQQIGDAGSPTPT